MASLKEFERFQDFVRFNKVFIERDPFLYFNLERTIDRVLNREAPLIKFFNVLDNNCFACCLMIENECLLYADKVTNEMLPEIIKGLEFEKFKRYQFFGTKNIIDLLFKSQSVEYSEQKHRKYYECSVVSSEDSYSSGYATMGEISRLSELISFSEKFHDEFYDGKGPDSDSETIILNGIEKGNIYQWIDSEKLVSMAQVIYEEQDHPVIGHVFTDPAQRGKGYAYSLIHTITKGLLEHGHEKCLLMTNAYNSASNNTFQKVGYKLTGEYVVRYKLK